MGLSRRETEAAFYLAGIIDGEGCVRFRLRPSTGALESKSLVIVNTDVDLIDATTEALELLGIHYTFRELPTRQKHWRQAWEININRYDDLDFIRDNIPLRSAKRDRLREMLSAPRAKKVA